MIGAYQDIDAGITYQCKDLEYRGIPLDLSELNLKIFRKNQELARLKEGLNQKFGFMPKFSDEKTWRRVFKGVTGHDVGIYFRSPRLSLSRQTVETVKHRCPELVTLYQGLRLEKFISQMTKTEAVKVEDQGKHYLKPRYRIDSSSGQVFLRDPNLRAWGKELKEVVRESGYTFLLVWYDALDLAVLQDLAQDPVLESDLESSDPYFTMACRFWETGSPTPVQVFIARMAFTLFCNGVTPDRFWTSINTTYSEQCFLTAADAVRLYEKFINHYTVCCEYFNTVSRMSIAQRSVFGRSGAGKGSRCYAMTSTMTDITKLGFLSVLEDSRFEKLGVTPLALVSYKMLLHVPCDQDLDQVKRYLTSDLRGAYAKYPLKICITSGSSWGECAQAGDLPQESE